MSMLFAAALMVVLSTDHLLAEDWSEWRGPSRTGSLKTSPPLIDSLEGNQLTMQWEIELPVGTYNRPYYGSPVASGGRAYLHVAPGAPDRKQVLPPPKPKVQTKQPDEIDTVMATESKTDDSAADMVPSAEEMEKASKIEKAKEAPRSNEADDMLLCVDIATGREAWRFERIGGVSSMGAPNTPCVAGGRVYFVGVTGVLYCVDASSGKEIWRADTSGGKRNDAFASSTIHLEGKIIVGGSKLVAIDATTGTKTWETDADTGCSSPTPWRKDGRTFVIAIGSKQIACVDAADGRTMWRIPCPSVSASPVVAGDTLVVMPTDKTSLIFTLSTKTAEKTGEFTTNPCGMGHQTCTPSVEGKLLYAWDAKKTFCYDLDKLAFVWEGETTGDAKPSPILADRKVICNNSRKVLILNAADGKTLVSANIGIASCTSAALADGRLLVNAQTHLRCYKLSKGN